MVVFCPWALCRSLCVQWNCPSAHCHCPLSFLFSSVDLLCESPCFCSVFFSAVFFIGGECWFETKESSGCSADNVNGILHVKPWIYYILLNVKGSNGLHISKFYCFVLKTWLEFLKIEGDQEMNWNRVIPHNKIMDGVLHGSIKSIMWSWQMKKMSWNCMKAIFLNSVLM